MFVWLGLRENASSLPPHPGPMTRLLPQARPSRASAFGRIPFAASQAAQVPWGEGEALSHYRQSDRFLNLSRCFGVLGRDRFVVERASYLYWPNCSRAASLLLPKPIPRCLQTLCRRTSLLQAIRRRLHLRGSIRILAFRRRGMIRFLRRRIASVRLGLPMPCPDRTRLRYSILIPARC